ncbi:MAG: sigma-54 dependent transcriptional regulator [Desulfuromonadales bacterium]|nr:sigma-54 dependent transcriptional regulator [Desulfuromonadales bacterium]
MSNPELIIEPNVPSRAPDLVAQQTAAGWLIAQISPKLAQWLSLGDLEIAGRSLSEFFADVSPGLDYLAEEALKEGQALTGLSVQFMGDESCMLQAEVAPGGLSHDSYQRQAHFFFRRPALGQAREHTPDGQYGLIGASPGMQEVFRKIHLYAETDASVVVTGETGSGKELVAKALHQESARSSRAFVAVNCSAISAELLESELFGHEKGAFTGALKTHKGRFERADQGTIFLDEVGDMPEAAQAKLLRVLEEGRLERVGSENIQEVDVRVVGATNVTLERAVQQGRFRADLYHRLAVLRIHLPPLRQRQDDIPLLVEHFLTLFRRKYNRNIERLTGEAMTLLQAYLWPGNVRELRNVLERVFIETRSEAIGAKAFREWVRERQDFSPGDWGPQSLDGPGAALPLPYPAGSEQLLLSRSQPAALLEAHNRKPHSTRPAQLTPEQIRHAYQSAGGNLTEAARLLGVHRATLYRYLERLKISRSDLSS